MKKRFYICYFVSFACCLCFGITMNTNLIPLMLLFAVLSGICVVWMCKIMESGEKWSYRKIKKHDKKWDEQERINKELRALIDGKADKLIDINSRREGKESKESNVRPGSRPSIEFMDMVVERGEKHDDRTKDQAAEDTAVHFCSETVEGTEQVAFGDL